MTDLLGNVEELPTAEAAIRVRQTTGPVCVAPMGCDSLVQVIKKDLIEMMVTGYDDEAKWLLIDHGDLLQVEYNGEGD